MTSLHTDLSLEQAGVERLIGASAAMRQVMQQISRIAAEGVDVLLSGEPGTGRETIARSIHAESRWSAGPFITVDCAKNPPQDLEELLFATSGRGNQAGIERRALERVRQSGRLYQSRGGTLFLQNVIDLPARAQLRLARVLRDREVLVMDGGMRVDLDHRVITAGDVALDAAVQDGRLLADLHKRLSAYRLDVPPLRDRREDIPELAGHLVGVLCARAGIPGKQLTDAAKSMLAALPWRGNGKELRKLLEGLISRVPGQAIGLDDVLANVRLDGHATWFAVGGSLREARARFESEYIAAVLAQHRGRIPEAAKTLGIQRSNLYRKLRRLKVRPKPHHHASGIVPAARTDP
jgi:two-component system nitrogen regulation response regulator NtrX